MTTSDFLVVLPSNASQTVFPDNSLATFKVKLQQPLPIFDRKWVVGLTEMMYPTEWYNIMGGYISVKYKCEPNFGKITTFRLRDGQYKDISTLINHIQTVFVSAKINNHVTLHYDEITKKVFLKITDDTEILFSQNLLNVLGLSHKEGEFYRKTVCSERSVDISEGFHAMYVYSNIVEATLVGDSFVPLLRVVPINNTEDTIKSLTFQNVQYHPVTPVQTDIIEINIRRDDGRVVPFKSGKVVLTLHFKRLI